MLQVLLTMIRLLFKLLFLPVRAALHILAFALKMVVAIGSVPAAFLAGIFYLITIGRLLEGCPLTDSGVWMPFAIGLLFSAVPNVGAFIVAIPLAVAALLKAITSPNPMQTLEDMKKSL